MEITETTQFTGTVPLVNHTNGASGASFSASPMPIAIIGLAGRFPGEAKNPTKLWDMCCRGKSAWSQVPGTRFNADAYFHPHPSKHGSMNARGGHFLEDDVGLFDANFFGISPNEAKCIDPQQRLLLETTYEAFESAGMAIEKLAGYQTGVYVGASQVDYSKLLDRDTHDIPMYHATGSGPCFLSNRISYFFDLKGPSMTLDTACSSSLSALHIACQSLRSGETSLAVVCGAHIMLEPDTMVGMSMLRMFAEEGLCHMYDERATGYGRGEGAVSLVLKRLDDALRDGDAIRTIIRNTGINQDGKTAGITLPSCEAQARLMRSVYDAVGLDPLHTAYVEAHGTGTAVGDPIEAEAIARVFAQDRSPDDPLIVGSVKTNIGHLEAASGLAAIVKATFILESGTIPPNLNFEQPNKKIPLTRWNIKIPTSLTPWPDSPLRRVSISNFGFGGSNAHVILDQYEPWKTHQAPTQNGTTVKNGIPNNPVLSQGMKAKNDHQPNFVNHMESSLCRRLFTFSANDKLSLKTQMADTASYLAEREDVADDRFMDRLAYTLCHRRSNLDWRQSIIASKALDLRNALNSDDEPVRASADLTCGYVFTGQGSQWHAMGRELLHYPVFYSSLLEADNAVRGLGAQLSLLDELHWDPKSSLINRPFMSQIATTALQIALVSLLDSWNISPIAVVGHSSGEIAAAYAAGALSLTHCMQLAYHRGVLAEALKNRRPDRPGAMLAIGATPEKVGSMIHTIGSDHIVIACINGPSLVTASGDADMISQLQSDAESEGLFNRRLKVDVAYHSPHMLDIATEYWRAIETVKTQGSSNVAFHSSLKGRQVDKASLHPEYWVQNMTSPVQFVDGVTSMYHKGCSPDILIEIGPHSTLEAAIRDIIKHRDELSAKVQYLPTLVRNRDAEVTMLSLASALSALGLKMNFTAINRLDPSNYPQLLYDLPTYPWSNRKRYWHETRIDRNHRMKKFPRHDLLGNLVDDFNDQEPRWRNILRLSEIPWLADHNVQGSTIFPFTGYLTMAIEAAFQYAELQGKPVLSSTTYKLREIQVSRPMIISNNSPVEVSLVLRPREEGSRAISKAWKDFNIFSWTSEKGWIEHCHGLISLCYYEQEVGPLNGRRQVDYQQAHQQALIEKHEEICTTSVEPRDIYARFASGGLDFGPVFRNIIAARAAKDHSVCTIAVPDTVNGMPNQFECAYIIHPGTFDACFQTLVCATVGGDLSKMDTHVPTFIEEIELRHGLLPNAPGDKFKVFGSRLRPFGDLDTNIHASFTAVRPGSDREVFLEIRGFVGSTLVSDDTDDSRTGDRQLCYQTQFAPSIDLMTPSHFNQFFRSTSETKEVMRSLRAWQRAAFHIAQATFDDARRKRDSPYDGHLQKLQRVLLDMLDLGNQGRLRFQTSEWLSCSDSQKQDFLTAFASSDPCGQLLYRLGEQYPAILDGEVEPLSIMLQDNLLENFYRNHEPVKGWHDLNAEVLRKMTHQNPSMRILELGAGTGAYTASSLRGLGRSFAQYDFTDISTGFFQKAKEELSEWGDMIRFRKLDIEDDPIAQGFEPESYDLVIAGNVLHATKNMTITMRNVRTLLKLGGKALISEVTSKLLYTTMIFGTLPGWWLGEEADRQDGPLLTEAGWDSLLQRTGFSGLDGSLDIWPEGIDLSRIMLSTVVDDHLETYPPASVLSCHDTEPSVVNTVCSQLTKLTGKESQSCNILTSEIQNEFAIVLALENPFLSALDAKGLNQLKSLMTTARGLLWVTRGARSQYPLANMTNGLARCIRKEIASISLVTLDLDGGRPLQDEQAAEMILHVFKSTFGSNKASLVDDSEFWEIDGLIQIARVFPNEMKDKYVERETRPSVPEPQPFHQIGRPLKMKLGQAGMLDTIHFVDDEGQNVPLNDSWVEISVRATGMNFKDVMIGLGQLPLYHPLGIECSGVVTGIGTHVTTCAVGDHVCGLAEDAYANNVRVSQYSMTKIPPGMSFTTAAAIPVVYCTAYHALYEIGRLSKGESILIHAAAGGVGQAAVVLAQRAQAEVFVTVGTAEKKALMQNQYGVPDDHIFSSRDSSFQQELMHVTKNRGVDMVLNSTAGETLRQSWQCLAPLGRFLEIGKRDLIGNSNLEMRKFEDAATFAAIDIGILSKKKPHAFKKLLDDVMKLYQNNEIQAVNPISIFSMSEVQQAMRMMQSGKHMGKVVIEANHCSVQALPAPSPRIIDSENASYLVTGGTGGLGRSLVRWLAEQGAKHIITASRSGMKRKVVVELKEKLREMGVDLIVKECDIGDRVQVQSLMAECQTSLPPIKGVIHGAMALRDALFENISYDDWKLNIKPRVDGAWNLHHCLAENRLDFFIILASTSGLTGLAGQAAYAASNTFLDSFSTYRNNMGLRTGVIDIGIVEGVGYVAESAPELLTLLHDRLTEAEVISLVKAHIIRPEGFQGTEMAQTHTGFKLVGDKPLHPSFLAPEFLHLLPQSNTKSSGQSDKSRTMRELLKHADSPTAVITLICEALRQSLSTLLMTAEEDVDLKKPVVAYGLDSLVAVELRNSISRNLDANVPLMELMNSPSIEHLAGDIARKSKLVDQALFAQENGKMEGGAADQ